MNLAQPMRPDTENGGVVKCEPKEATLLYLYLPGPSELVILNVQMPLSKSRKDTPNWSWNGSVEAPTLRPSLLTNKDTDRRCHVWVTDGKVQFLNDTKHDLKGQTIPLLDIDSCRYINN